MLFFKYYFQLSLLTTASIISSVFVANLPAKAATFSSSEAFLFLSNFSTPAQNSSVKSKTTTFSASRNNPNLAKAEAEASTIFITDSDDDFLSVDLYTEAYGEGNSFFGFGESSSFAVGDFSINANQTFSFDFSLALFNQAHSPLNSSNSSLSGVQFFLFDDRTNDILGNFSASNNLSTNLVEYIDSDLILLDSDDVFRDIYKSENFEGDIELVELFLSGSFERFFDTNTQVRLEVATFSSSCVQLPLNYYPCQKVPEPNNTVTLLFGFLGLGLVSRLAKQY